MSLEHQLARCREYAREMGWLVKREFGNKHESAKDSKGKEFNRMLEYVKNRQNDISYIIVYNYDRYSRTGGDAIQTGQELLNKHDVAIVSVSQRVDPRTPAGQFQQNIHHVFANYDNAQRIERIRAGMLQLLEAGIWAGGKVPRGYTQTKIKVSLPIRPKPLMATLIFDISF